MKRKHFGQHGDDCFGCKIQTVGLDPSAVPTRRNTVAPTVSAGANSWERGIVRDERGMPLLDKDGVIGVKQYAENRGRYEAAEKKLAAEAAANTTR